MGKTIGIDLGTTNSVVAFKDTSVRVIATGPNNEDLCRSCVAMDKSGSFIVGNAPYRNWRKYAPNIVVSVKRLMGASISDPQVQKMQADKEMYPYGIKKLSGGTEDSVAVVLGGKEFTPEQISAEILQQLKEDASVKLGDEVTHAVITVPAYFNEKQKTATRKAAEIAGLKVQQLLAEPTAAAISYGADKMSKDEDKIFLVYDFGGGTFDLSILVASGGNFIESGTGGDRWLGGDDIDRLLTEYVLAESEKDNNVNIHDLINSLPEKRKYAFQGELKNEVESAKKSLSQSASATVSVFDYLETEDGDPVDIEVSITREQFENMIRPLVQRTLDLIDDLLTKTNYPIDAIDNILLVGGSSCIPLVRQMLSDKYGKEKVLSSEKPMLAIAEGAAILSSSLGTEFECPNCGNMVPVGSDECPHCHHKMNGDEQFASSDNGDGVMVSVTTKHKYFVEVADDADNKDYVQIIDENESLPTEVNHKFYTLVDNQKIVEVDLYTDKEGGEKEKISSGFFTISENLPVHSELQFSFRLDVNETMNVRVRVAATGKTTDLVLGRGHTDQHCLQAISDSFDKVMNDTSVSDSKKQEFLGKLQDTIENINTNRPSDNASSWQNMEQGINIARQAALSKEEDNSVYEIIAKILLTNFGRFINEDDKEAMRRDLNFVEETDVVAKNAALKRLETYATKYGLLIDGFMLNIAGHDKGDPVKANRALVAYNQFMAALNAGDIARARDILSANESLIIDTPLTGGSTTGIGGN